VGANDLDRTTPLRAPAWLSPSRRIVLLTAVLALAGSALFWGAVQGLHVPGSHVAVPWLIWVIAFAAAEVFVVHVQVKRDSHSFSLSDLVLAAGLYLVAPGSLVTAHLCGFGLVLVLHRRQFGVKLAFNLAQTVFSTSVATLTFATLSGLLGGAGAWSWVAALLAIAASTVASNTCIFTVISLSEGSLNIAALRGMLALSLPFALGMAAVGLLAATTAVQNPAGLGLLALPSVLLISGYRAFTKAREQQNNLLLLHEVTSLLYNSGDAPTALTDFLGAVRTALRAQTAELVLIDEAGGPMTLSRSADGEDAFALRSFTHTDDVDALLTWCTGHGVRTARTGGEGGAQLERYASRHALKDSMVSVLQAEDRVLGLLLVSGRLGDVGTFAGSDLALLETFGRHVATSLDRGRLDADLRRVTELQEELRHAAMHDPLTQMPNRTLFLDRTQHALNLAGRNGLWPAVLYIDLDGFKPVNDTHGHQAGDVLLKVFSQRLHESVRTADTAARLGGDEFAVLLHGPIDESGIEQVLTRLRTQLGLPVALGSDREAHVGASIGVALAGPDTDIDTLIRRADLAMYTAKRTGKGRSVYYDAALEDGGSPATAPVGRPAQAAVRACPHALLVDGSLPHGCALGAEATAS
jgi:diguanylate cyclase (GGDEF)-like protein